MVCQTEDTGLGQHLSRADSLNLAEDAAMTNIFSQSSPWTLSTSGTGGLRYPEDNECVGRDPKGALLLPNLLYRPDRRPNTVPVQIP